MNKKIALMLVLASVLMLGALPPLVLAGGDENESALTLNMDEFYFQLDDQEPGQAVVLEAGKGYKLTLVNAGKIEHEVMVGQGARFMENGARHGYLDNFFSTIGEFTLKPGNEVALDLEVPEAYAGQTFEIGCFIPGHYQAGMKLELRVVASSDHGKAAQTVNVKDTDNDGIPDSEDYCPTFAGKPITNGC